ncbi:hypothetical protein DSO57_1001535 [Entomophthora muscae]|uniref:Uncharacterized protein n=1 Tax=Entomophthora muscae TaxID=34485 RepID=A0ACC2RP12_9FUNG|nr:hypothetical protein DSO57_1001535 [Entomophthora muscae]
MKDIPTVPPLPGVPPTQDFRKLGFVYITVLGLANQVVPHTGSWRLLATALNYLVHIAPIVYMAFQARPASPVGVQPDSGIGRDIIQPLAPLSLAQDPANFSIPFPTTIPQTITSAWFSLSGVYTDNPGSQTPLLGTPFPSRPTKALIIPAHSWLGVGSWRTFFTAAYTAIPAQL